MMGKVTVISSGLCTTIQDKGRFGFSKYGVPKSGAMDQRSFLLANYLLGNKENCAVIEWAMMPPVLQFDEPTLISVTGAECIPFLNEEEQKMNTSIQVFKNDVLMLKNVQNGCFGFVGIKNGFQTEMILKSRSYYKGITNRIMLMKNDHILYEKNLVFDSKFASVSIANFWINSDKINCFEGPEFHLLSESQKLQLFVDRFTISNSKNRMAIQLSEPFFNNLSSMISAPVLPGTIQLTPSGKLIVLMRDCQTVGGYPRILQLTKESINVIAQKRAGEGIHFHLRSFDIK
ncbi:biotin-dependent carboxyltransferase family protein [Aquimarina addita]|uniref:Biotin-dependent carboxyltransferase family protein n=1 Tax=Aquimarina addita TaxID=870485 RepID=A0ABP6UK24_9FLAO